MVYKPNSTKTIFEAVILCLLLLGTGLMSAVGSRNTQPVTAPTTNSNKTYYDPNNPTGTFVLDRSYYTKDDPALTIGGSDHDDAGNRRDSGNSLATSNNLYPGELLDNTPGRGRTGKLSSTDTSDWNIFPIAKGQQVYITLTPPSGFDFDLGVYDQNSNLLASSNNTGITPETILYTAPDTMKICMCFRYVSGTGQGQYQFTVNMTNQNDANTGADAGNTMNTAVLITPGIYPGYLDMNDPYDWYSFEVTQGQWINLTLNMKSIALLTDFDVWLYNPSGTLVYGGNNYYDDTFDYQADVSGLWFARVDIYPGWVDCPHPTQWQYYSYGSGPYKFTLAFKSSTTNPPPGPISEPQITPIAKTYTIPNVANSTTDDFGYLAAIPASNYLAGGQRYVAPIIYSGDKTPTAYYDDPTAFGIVDNTTQYLVNDWNAYLAAYGKTPQQYTVPSDPIQAAADIATHSWTSSSTAVVAVDGSGYQDTTRTALKKTATLVRSTHVTDLQSTDSRISSTFGYLMNLGPKWCAMSVNVSGISVTNGNANGALLLNLYPKFMAMGADDWPTPYDGPGYAGDIYMPLTRAGMWAAQPGVTQTQYSTLHITTYAGDRYRFKVTSSDSVIDAVLTTASASDLLVFLVDPQGNLRSPIIPAWNGPVNPMFEWNGEGNPSVNPWREWNPTPHTEFSAEVLHPQAGTWTAIVVPKNAAGSNVKYTLTTTVRTVSSDRADATVSAANAAVIASLNHLPLLYVTKDTVPAATASAFTTLGVTHVIFVERGGIGAAVRGSLPTVQKDLTTMQEIVTDIKGYSGSENYITITSLKTGNGFFAPAAMLAAYHGSPVILVEDSPYGDAAGVAERVQTWQRWDGDYYHGSRANGHMPLATAPVDQSNFKLLTTFVKFLLNKDSSILPPLGRDAKRYWNQEMVYDMLNYTKSLGLDRDGQEGYAVVAPRADIPMELHSGLMGNNSYAGDIPGLTPAYSSDIVVRDILYPALIFVNPGRNVTTGQVMNYPEGMSFMLNDGKTHPAKSSSAVKSSFSSHLRTFIGHTFWASHVQQMNEGASVFYYSGHGTGGSGMAAMYPQSNLSNYPDQIWWDGWRGYMYDIWKTPRDASGLIWFNPEPPELYDVVHYKWIDQSFQNLHSNAVFYMSCTTGDGDAPLVYLDHGALCWYGNANTGLCPEADIGDDAFFNEALVHGVSIGVAFSHQVWLHYRDFTTLDPTSMYGPASMQVQSIQVIYGDPALVIFSPEWTSPVPIDASFY